MAASSSQSDIDLVGVEVGPLVDYHKEAQKIAHQITDDGRQWVECDSLEVRVPGVTGIMLDAVIEASVIVNL